MNKRPLYTGGLVTLHRWIGLVTLHRWIGYFTQVDWSLYTGGLVTVHRWIGLVSRSQFAVSDNLESS